MFKMSEWAVGSSYGVGLHQGANASHILVRCQTIRGRESQLVPLVIWVLSAFWGESLDLSRWTMSRFGCVQSERSRPWVASLWEKRLDFFWLSGSL